MTLRVLFFVNCRERMGVTLLLRDFRVLNVLPAYRLVWHACLFSKECSSLLLCNAVP